MSRATVRAIGAVGVMVAVPLVVVGLGLRYRWPVVLDGLRRLSRDVVNPGQLATAGEPGAYASIIEHTGRVSGQRYRTPVVVRPVDAGFVVTLTYGSRADWVRNVEAAGSATLTHDGRVFESLEAEVVPLERAGAWLSPGERRLLRWFGIETCLHLGA